VGSCAFLRGCWMRDAFCWDTVSVDGVGWLSEYSEAALRSALGVAGAGLEQLPIELTGTNDLSRPMWASGSATIDGRFLAKFAFSEPTAVRMWHEARVLKLLGEQPAFDVPDLVAASPDPACLATRIVDGGVPLSYELVRASIPERVGALAAGLARFLANLHAPQSLALARERLDDPLRIPAPGLQATTDALRLRFTPMIQARQRARLRRWCDWADQQLAAPRTIVFVHGDFHPYNQLWDAEQLRLLLVADFETSGIAEPEYDFRAIPSFGPGIDLLTSTIDEYMVLTGRRLSLERIMALHLCTSLGDALWRTEAGLPLLLPRPGGGTPDDYVDELAARFALAAIEH
jgi:Phosphotransferase enzyme family